MGVNYVSAVVTSGHGPYEGEGITSTIYDIHHCLHTPLPPPPPTGRPDGPYFPAEMRRMLMKLEAECGARYLEDGSVEVMGVTFWGTPWTPKYGGE